MSPTDIPTVVALAVASLLLVGSLPRAVRAWQAASGVSTRRQEDATGRAPKPVGELAERIAELEARGYRRLGETWTSMPGGGSFTVVFGSSDETAYALLAPAGGRGEGLTGFYSAWRDGQWLGTLRPFGDPYETTGLRLRVMKESLAAAEAAHQAEAAAMRAQHGDPRRIATLGDVLQLDVDYRTRFGGRELRPMLLRALFPVALMGFLVAFFAVALVVLP